MYLTLQTTQIISKQHLQSINFVKYLLYYSAVGFLFVTHNIYYRKIREQRGIEKYKQDISSLKTQKKMAQKKVLIPLYELALS